MNFVFDIDGTLCFDGKTIDSSIVKALHTLRQNGHDIIFASARPIRDLMPVIPAAFQNGKLVGGNGCYTAEDGQVTAQFFTEALLKQLLALIESYKLAFLADGEWDYCYTGSTDHPIYKNIDQSNATNRYISELRKVCKLVLFNPPQEVLLALEQLPVSVTTYKNEHAIDISPHGINKVFGLKQLHIDDFVAFGNDSNDQCLFETARYSVCVGDHDVQQYASCTIQKERVAEMILELGRKVNHVFSHID